MHKTMCNMRTRYRSFHFSIVGTPSRAVAYNMAKVQSNKIWVSLSMSRHFIFGSSAIRVSARVRSLRSKLFPRSSPNPNGCTLERSKSARTLIYESQRFRIKADGLYLTTPQNIYTLHCFQSKISLVWKKIASMKFGKIVFHSIPCRAACV